MHTGTSVGIDEYIFSLMNIWTDVGIIGHGYFTGCLFMGIYILPVLS
jgi:hypothetical protein